MLFRKIKSVVSAKLGSFAGLNRTGVLAAGLMTVGIGFLWKTLPKEFSTVETSMVFAFMIVCLLCLSLAIRIQLPDSWKGRMITAILIFMPAVCFFNTEYVVGNSIWNMKLLMVLLNYALYFICILILFAVTNRIGITAAAGMAFFTLYALANSFIKEFRGVGIRTADIFAVRTAMNVSAGYELIFTFRRALIVLIALAVIFLVLHFYEYRIVRLKIRMCVIAGVIGSLFLLSHLFRDKEFMSENEVKPYIWDIEESAQVHGALLDFAGGIPYLKVERPNAYSVKNAMAFEEEGAEKKGTGLHVSSGLDGKRPDIIVIMNESFADLGQMGEFKTDQAYLKYFYSLQDNVVRGNVSVPVYGGLTANTEFEFLTGFSNVFFPGSVIAYQNYVKEGTPNLGQWLQKIGYHSIFMHPMDANGWNRRNVYQAFGFDESYYIEDFENKSCIRGVISDSSNYKEVIRRYEDAKAENESLFLFNVTMQNHGGYMTDDYEKTVHLKDMEGNYPKTEEYLSLIHESDSAFKKLIDYFSQKEDPVLICMFGDHQPSIEPEFYEEIQNDSDESDLLKQAKKYQTPFIIYANYDLDEKFYDNISMNYLQVLLLNAAALPLDTFHSYLESLYESYPVINLYGMKDRRGLWSDWTSAEEAQEIREYSVVQYWKLFDR